MIEIEIPRGAQAVMELLEESGFQAYVVGGCVRDSLLGLAPHDWDICTDAAPGQVLEICAGRGIRTIETGLKHGTVTVCPEGSGEHYEVTTFRIDGGYSDGRHPDSVTFTADLHQDLARRDFTMNAMAYRQGDGLIDPFGGQRSLRGGEIACVGGPFDRFGEDALRIMRALRFASVYELRIGRETAAAIHACAPALRDIAVERVNAELCKLLCGRGVLPVLLDYSDVMAVIIPELGPCIGFDQNNRYHRYTVYGHIAHAVAAYTGSDLSVKTALLLHDIGKPLCYTEDQRGGHFYGHGILSRDIAEEVTRRLRFDNRTRDEVLDLVLYHDSVIEPTPKAVRRWLNKIGEERFRQLLQVCMADTMAHAEETQAPRIRRCLAVREILEEVLAQEQCFSLKDMRIDGRDVMALGVPQGVRVGEILNALLGEVIGGELPNERGALLARAAEYK